MNVLSLFDGIGCAYSSLTRAGLAVNTYFSSEVDKHAIAVASRHIPCYTPVGDVRGVLGADLPPIDLLIGGSPCQDLSIAKKDRKGLAGNRSGLFWEYVRILREVNPKWFVLENVASMPKADRDVITKELGVDPVMIDAALVSAQSRKRLFWTTIPVTLPADRGIVLKDILQPDAEVDESMTVNGKAFCLTATIGRDIGRRLNANGTREDSNPELPYQRRIELREDAKSGTLTSVQKDNLVVNAHRIRKLTPIECERLQGLPDDYTAGLAKTHRYKCLGNAFNVDVVAHILAGTTRTHPCATTRPSA